MSPQPWSYFFLKGVRSGIVRQDFPYCILIAPQRSGSYWLKIWKNNSQSSEKERSRLEFGAHIYRWNLSHLEIIVHWLFNFLEMHPLFTVLPGTLGRAVQIYKAKSAAYVCFLRRTWYAVKRIRIRSCVMVCARMHKQSACVASSFKVSPLSYEDSNTVVASGVAGIVCSAESVGVRF